MQCLSDCLGHVLALFQWTQLRCNPSDVRCIWTIGPRCSHWHQFHLVPEWNGDDLADALRDASKVEFSGHQSGVRKSDSVQVTAAHARRESCEDGSEEGAVGLARRGYEKHTVFL